MLFFSIMVVSAVTPESTGGACYSRVNFVTGIAVSGESLDELLLAPNKNMNAQAEREALFISIFSCQGHQDHQPKQAAQ
jgi:hypothetical protein